VSSEHRTSRGTHAKTRGFHDTCSIHSSLFSSGASLGGLCAKLALAKQRKIVALQPKLS